MGMGNAFRNNQQNLRRRIFSGRLSPRKGKMKCFHHVKEYPWFIRRRRGIKTTVFAVDFWTTILLMTFGDKFIWLCSLAQPPKLSPLKRPPKPPPRLPPKLPPKLLLGLLLALLLALLPKSLELAPANLESTCGLIASSLSRFTTILMGGDLSSSSFTTILMGDDLSSSFITSEAVPDVILYPPANMFGRKKDSLRVDIIFCLFWKVGDSTENFSQILKFGYISI